MPGTPSITASIAAETVPEYSTSSPMFGPWLIPENTKSGRSGISACIASITQSVGVPSTCHAPSGRRCGRSGRCSVREWLVPLCSRSGATTVTLRDIAARIGEVAKTGSEDAIVVRDEDVHCPPATFRPSIRARSSSSPARRSRTVSSSSARRDSALSAPDRRYCSTRCRAPSMVYLSV